MNTQPNQTPATPAFDAPASADSLDLNMETIKDLDAPRAKAGQVRGGGAAISYNCNDCVPSGG
jgi:hypothetical protein